MYYRIVEIDRATIQRFIKPFKIYGAFQSGKHKEVKINKLRNLDTQSLPERGLIYCEKEEKVIQFIGKSGMLLPKNIFKIINDSSSQKNMYSENGIPEKLNLYHFAHKMIYVLLAEVYQKKKNEDMDLYYSTIFDYLGYEAKDRKHKKIRDLFKWLEIIEFINFKYTFDYSNKNNIPVIRESKIIKPALRSVKRHRKYLKVSVNENFAGVIMKIINGQDIKSGKARDGYFKFPIGILKLTKIEDFSPCDYFLTEFLLRERGNPELNKKYPEGKVISYNINKYIEEAAINIEDSSKKLKRLISALKKISELGIIDKIGDTGTDSTISYLKSRKAENILNGGFNMRVYMKDLQTINENINKSIEKYETQ